MTGDGMRDQLAAALAGTSVRVDFAGLITNNEARRVADALLPVVDAIAAERAAKELRGMSRWTVDTGYADAAVLREFRDRADALDPS